MAAPVGGNELARRVVDDLIDFSGQTSVNGYMNFFKAQQIAEARRDDVRVENAMLMGLNELVTQAEEEIEMKEAQVDVRCLVDHAAWYVHFEELDAYVTVGSLAKLSEVAEHPRLADKMNKKRRLVAELEAVGEVECAAKCVEHMRVIVARDAVTRGELETLLARAQVGVSLKAGFVADIDVKD
ncbi:hypothetical protein Tco_0835088 [Tanacetum coccineum]